MSRIRTTILLTGFGPFPGVPKNISTTVAFEIGAAARRMFPRTTVRTVELPTEWATAPRLLEEYYISYQPAIALHFGVSSMARSLTIETRAHNRAARVDAAGCPPSFDVLADGGPQERLVTLPGARLVARMQQAAIPATISHDAGSYLCNGILYYSLALMHIMNPDGKCGFVHLPTHLPRNGEPQRMPPSSKLSYSDAIAGGLQILSVALQRPAEAIPQQAQSNLASKQRNRARTGRRIKPSSAILKGLRLDDGWATVGRR